ncbi:MAG: hypothetical protein SynsKO_25220 [Synoicihabitans sp.]
MKPSYLRVVLGFMSQPRLAALAILGLTTVTAAGLAYQQYLRAEELAAKLAQSPVDLPPRVERSEVRAAFAEDTEAPKLESDAPEVSSEELSEEPREERRRDDRGGRSRNDIGARVAEMMADPQYAEAFKMQQVARLDTRYADLFAQLNLPPATLSKLQDLLIEKQNSARDVFMAAREEGFNGREDRDQIRALMEATQAEIDADIRAAIGDANFDSLQAYEGSVRQRAMVDQLESRLSYSGTPLNSTQAQALTSILTETGSTQGRGGRGGDSPFGGGGSVTITDQTIARAQGVLSGPQLDALQALKTEQEAAQMLSQAMRSGSQRGSNSSPAETSGPRGGGGG